MSRHDIKSQGVNANDATRATVWSSDVQYMHSPLLKHTKTLLSVRMPSKSTRKYDNDFPSRLSIKH